MENDKKLILVKFSPWVASLIKHFYKLLSPNLVPSAFQSISPANLTFEFSHKNRTIHSLEIKYK